MIWGCMAAHQVGRIKFIDGTVNADRYLKILSKEMLLSKRDMFPGNADVIFQDDNAPCHRAKKVKEWMLHNNLRTLDWPAQSPDLNPIENLWHKIGIEIAKSKPRTKLELKETVIRVWYHHVTPAYLENLVHSMPRRCAEVVKNKGYPTKY